MKKLLILIIIFCLFLSIPLYYFILRTYLSLEQEEVSKFRYFGETLFDQMEGFLAELVVKEESRAVDEYNYYYNPKGLSSVISPLSKFPYPYYIIGYLQNNPDGSFETPVLEKRQNIPPNLASLITKLTDVNNSFNSKRASIIHENIEAPSQSYTVASKEVKKDESFGGKFLDFSRSQKQKVYLGQEEKRVEEIPASQALNLSKQEQNYPQNEIIKGEIYHNQAEITPMQSLIINNSEIFIFRRIMIANKIYRQGFVINAKAFLNNLANLYFNGQPMANFTGLKLNISDRGYEISSFFSGVQIKNLNFSLKRVFGRPFSFLSATLLCEDIPKSSGRKTLNIMMIILNAIIFIGMFTIYKSAKTVMDLSNKKASFVSSVTHELKTPLTNIRMYIEMLEQGIAGNIEREAEYFHILENETSRLSRLINNVLEFSKIEQKRFDIKEGTFDDVIKDVYEIMGKSLRKEGFIFKINLDSHRFSYDREVMIQVMINLIENSIKFGTDGNLKEIVVNIRPYKKWIKISVSDTGQGIPAKELTKIFNDFYRAENAKNKRGTGIGLALVKKLIIGMGGRVYAKNNEKTPGCTITLMLPNISQTHYRQEV
ncbi:MAG: HAMP domain-containing histidine kinase [Desulfobacterales bacterium]|nr:HAMP domain-containing histidine kinase [Desulfobacterales bacterium]